ncbi:MAG: 2-oxoacid:acceptor oxidoreductase family protein [Owenweeksia sp.]|nr:2-oxoacid:acceptor oxidoreductase family protein [Owenweeksia sp.]
MQLAGGQFTQTTALAGNDLSTYPDFPAEIRAPMGTVAGVSGFQINFGSVEINTPGSNPDVLVVMNAAAFKKTLTTSNKAAPSLPMRAVLTKETSAWLRWMRNTTHRMALTSLTTSYIA